jgi:uncharacterized protein
LGLSECNVLFDLRLHPAALDDSDLETLLHFGVTHVLCPADTTPQNTPKALRQHFDNLIEKQIPRLEKAGLKAYAAIGVHPNVLPKRGTPEVLQSLPDYLNNSKVKALGLLSLKNLTDEAAKDALVEQLQLAKRLQRPVLLAAPVADRENATRAILKVLSAVRLEPEQVAITGVNARTVRSVREWGYSAGFILHPEHSTPEAAVAAVKKLGPERLFLCTAAGDGPSDLLGLARSEHLLEKAGLSRAVVQRVTFTHAARFLSLA